MSLTAKAIFSLTLAYWFLSCSTLQHPISTNSSQAMSKNSSLDSKQKEADGTKAELSLSGEQSSEDELSLVDVLEEGFCYDDIYASYLKRKYYWNEMASFDKKMPYKLRLAREKRIESESLFYARSHLVGPMPPNYGALPVASNDAVEFWIRYFQTVGRQTFVKWLVRSQSFKNIVSPILREEGLPQDLFFLAMVESGFNNSAYSKKAATGTWQFMQGTAKLYDLKINHWVDERRDPAKSTIAAAKFLKDLYADFGDWYLAMAAYNAGPGKIRKAMRAANTRDFWKLIKTPYIRPETKQYVPKVLAALALASVPKQYGFDVKANPADMIPNTTITIDRPVKIDELAYKLSLPLDALQKWNPELIRGITPPQRNGSVYKFRLPETQMETFNQIKESLSVIEVTDVLMHTIHRGDTLSQIARRYGVRIPQILEINPRLSAKTLGIGKQIAIPVPGIVTKSKEVGKRLSAQKKEVG